MSTILSQIPQLFQNKSEHSFLTLENIKGSYEVNVEEKLSTLKLKSTWECLSEIIGKSRLERITQNPDLGLDISKIQQHTLALSRSVARNLFIGLMDIQKADFEDNQSCVTIAYRYQKILFFKNLEEVEGALLGVKPPDLFFDRAKTSGKGLEGLAECVYIFMQHHFNVVKEQSQKAAELRDIEMLTSRFAEREIRTGSVVHLHDGYFYVDKVFVGGGAYVYVLLDLESKHIPKLVCRGTAMRSTATDALKSVLNDYLIEIGTLGVKTIWPPLSAYLKENKINALQILGKSLGGAHAQELAVLIEGINGIKVEKLITNCSVGTGNNINQLFKNEILSRRTTPFAIQILRNGGRNENEMDYIPAAGGVHLGEGTDPKQCQVDLYYMQPGNAEVGVYPIKQSLFSLICNIIKSFTLAHCRQTTLQNFSWKKIENRDEVNEHLRMGNKLEPLRQCVAYIVHLCTLTLLNGRSFNSFFFHQKSKGQEVHNKDVVVTQPNY